MMNILDNFSDLHNLKQREGLHPTQRGDLKAYVAERYLIRTISGAITFENTEEIAQQARLGPGSVRDCVEDYCYRLSTESLFEAVKILDEHGLIECVRYICLEAQHLEI